MPHPLDGLRLVSLLVVPAALIFFDALSALVMLLVSGGCWALRGYAAERRQDLFGQVVLLASGAFSVLGTYHQVPGLDLVVHFFVLWVLTGLGHDVMNCHRMVSPPVSTRHRMGLGLLLTGLGALLAVLWEIGEWVGHKLIDPQVGVGYSDTLGDLLFGLLGAAMAGCQVAGRRPCGAAS